MKIIPNKISYLFENGWQYGLMKLLARIPVVKSILASLAKLPLTRAPNFPDDITDENFYVTSSVPDIVEELKVNGFSKNIICKQEVVEAISKVARTKPLFAYHNKQLAFQINDRLEFEKKLNMPILIAHYANLNQSKIFAKLENDTILTAVAKHYLGDRAKCIASQMWWTFKADVTDDVRSKAAHFYHRDLDAYQFMKFFIYLTDVGVNDGAHFFVRGSHRPYIIHSLREKFRISRVDDAKIKEWYGDKNIIEMTGKAGSVIAEDTFGFHKGQSPTNNARLLACFVFANQDYCVQRFTV